MSAQQGDAQTPVPSVVATIATGIDDVEQDRNGPFLTSEPTLKMRDDTLVGLRYNVCIPAGANITDAWIRVTASDDDSATSTALIRIERVPDSESFATNPSIIGRFASTAEASWSMPTFVSGETYDSSDISSVISEVINLSGWSGCGHILLVIENAADREIVAFDGSAADAPVLNINYDT